ncbi:MAG: hypothetical protein RIC16_04785 [Rhodospirillales bacterium]
MLVEALHYLITPCDPRLRRLGYLRELIATEARARRCRHAWRPHLERARAVIETAIAETRERDRAVVLGGGLIHDIPLDALARAFRNVALVDVCFARRTRRAVRALPNVTLQTFDLTGVADQLAAGAPHIEVGGAASPGRHATLDWICSADLVISANLLSQLPLIPLGFLLRRDGPGDGTALDDLARALIDDHLGLLKNCRGTVCLITELERLTCDGDAVVERDSAVFGADLDLAGETWTWDIAPRPEACPDRDVRLRVGSAIWPARSSGTQPPVGAPHLNLGSPDSNA